MGHNDFVRRSLLLAAVLLPGMLNAQADFVRGDANQARGLEIGDATTIANWIFIEGAPPGCEDSADFDDDGLVGFTDAVSILNFIFLGGVSPPSPFPTRGQDATLDDLPCAAFNETEIPVHPSLKFVFEGCPTERLSGSPGQVIQLEVFASIESSEDPGGEGPQAWSMSIAVGDASVKAVAVKGVVVQSLFDEDGQPATPLTNVPLDLVEAEFKLAHKATGDYPDSPIPGKKGVASAVALGLTQKRVLPPKSIARVSKLTLEVTIPNFGEPRDVVLKFEDGYMGAGRPVRNLVVLNNKTYVPTFGECCLGIGNCGPAPVPTSAFVRGDANANRRVDLADAAWTINALFRGGPATACRVAADCNDDGSVNVSDVVYTIQYLLLGGPSPPMPFPSCGLFTGLTREQCPRGSTACP